MPQVGPGELLLVAGYFIIAVGIGLAVVAALFLAVRWLDRALFGPPRRLEAELGLEALEGRRRRGEITQAEFDQAKRALGV
jgi:uncharacterized membrane protein